MKAFYLCLVAFLAVLQAAEFAPTSRESLNYITTLLQELAEEEKASHVAKNADTKNLRNSPHEAARGEKMNRKLTETQDSSSLQKVDKKEDEKRRMIEILKGKEDKQVMEEALREERIMEQALSNLKKMVDDTSIEVYSTVQQLKARDKLSAQVTQIDQLEKLRQLIRVQQFVNLQEIAAALSADVPVRPSAHTVKQLHAVLQTITNQE